MKQLFKMSIDKRKMRCTACLLWKVDYSPSLFLATKPAGKCFSTKRFYTTRFVLEELEDNGASNSQMQHNSMPRVSLAKRLACLTEHSAPEQLCPDKQKKLTRAELKRLIELRIKKKVKSQYLNGKFYDLMDNVIAKSDTLQDSYDIIRLNSNIEMASDRDDICFKSMAELLVSGDFDIGANAMEISLKNGKGESLVLPKLKLRVIQEAMRVVLEVIYRPHFSKVSHGCRSGRGQRSAINYISKEVPKCDWWFTIHPSKASNQNVIFKLLSIIEEKVPDKRFLDFISRMFDARLLNFTFGGFPKGHGLPQEGTLSPILMNIYLDNFDREVLKISMRYEGLGSGSTLRSWVRSQIKDKNVESEKADGKKVRACRFMDEIFVSVSGSKNDAQCLKLEMINYLKNLLYLDVEDQHRISKVKGNRSGLQFLGITLSVLREESDAVKAVHKLKHKVQLFASQKQEIWDTLTKRIGKKWLAHGLKRVKESEIKALNLSTPLMDHISQFRKDGMKTEHWFKSLVKIWMQDMKAYIRNDEQLLLSKYIAEPALPDDLKESFYNFQKQAENYISSETSATLALLPANLNAKSEIFTTKVEAPIGYITKSLQRYGLVNLEGYPRYVHALILQDDNLILNWFSGLVLRWIKWYSKFDNFEVIKLLIVECVRKSCIRTLAAKYRIHESLIEKKFESQMDKIPFTREFDNEGKENNDDEEVDDEGLMYGISYSGLCMLSLSRVKVPNLKFNCFVMGCAVECNSLYTIHVMERQRFPGWKTGFYGSVHPSLNGRRIGLCCRHLEDLYLNVISLQSIEFGALSR